jgi:hypothetical protein
MSTLDGLTATTERMSRAKGRTDFRQRDLRVNRPADRIVPVFELMRRRDQITSEEFQAGEQFANYWYGARRTPGLVGSYGDQRWSGTSVGQADASQLILEERPIHCAQQLAEARNAIGQGQLYDALERIVIADATLEDVGREFINYSGAKQCQAAGVAMIKCALQRLANHYGYTRQKVPR